MNKSDNPSHIVIHTDGACSYNPGPGGWAAIVHYRNGDDLTARLELSGGDASATNNRMELTAVCSALAFIQNCEDFAPSTPITIASDSEYVVKGFSTWLPRWKEKHWRGSDKKPVKNQDLWKWLDFVATGLVLSFQWVRGHAGNPENEAADALARAAIPVVSPA